MDIRAKKSTIGLSISPQVIELAVFSPKQNSVGESVSMATPVGMLDINGDRLLNPQMLRDALNVLFKQVRTKVDSVNLSLPGTLFRMVDMPRLAPEQLYVSLSSEAERYKTFDNTDAVVDFAIVENTASPPPPNKLNLVFAAMRRDALEDYLSVLKSLRVKAANVSLEPIDILRGMAGSGVLDSLVEQIGLQEFWGCIFVEPERVRFSLWQGSTLFEFRETNINTSDFSVVGPDSLTVSDMVEEIRRTTKMGFPRLWLTEGMPGNMQGILSDLLSLPVRDCNLGNALALNNPNLRLATIGAALTASVPFPFAINLIKGIASLSGKNSGGAAMAEASGGDANANLITFGGIAVVISLIISGFLWFGSTMLQGQVNDLQSQFDQKQTSVNALTVQRAELQAKVSVYQKLKAALDEARMRNRVYVRLSEDLRNKSPKRLWVQDIHVGGGEYAGKVALEGKALHHEEILYFARSFDRVPYLKALTIEQIKEQRLLGVPLFNYKIQGELDLKPSLMDNASPALPASQTP